MTDGPASEPPEMIGFMERQLERGRQQHDALSERVFKQGSALSTWLVLGNAGALLLAATALIEGSTFPADLLRFSALCFALGLLLTVAGMMLGFLATTLMVGKLSVLLDQLQAAWISDVHIEALERGGIKVAEDNALRVSLAAHEAAAGRTHASAKRVAWVGVSIASALTLAGCIAFGVGVLRPLLAPSPIEAPDPAVRSAAPDPSLSDPPPA